MPLDTALSTLKGVGPRRAAALAGAGLHTIDDLLTRFPLRYEDRLHWIATRNLVDGQVCAVRGVIESCRLRPTRRPGFSIYEARVADGTGVVDALWFNQRFLRQVFAPGQHVVLYGRVEPGSRGGHQLSNPDFEMLAIDGAGDEAVHTGRIVPVYERVGPMTSKLQRSLVWQALEALPDEIDDPLPAPLRERMELPARRAALAAVHFPDGTASLADLDARRTPAHRRLVFEEFFLFNVGVAAGVRARRLEEKPWRIRVDESLRARLRRALPFRLTPGQKQALKTIVDDLRAPAPMNRLLQGDVGSGKTIVAVLTALVVIHNDRQVAFMAPTEVLATQHFYTLRALLAGSGVTPVLVTGELGARGRREAEKALASGTAMLAVGTHALAEATTTFARLGLAIIDEQHRFGVLQRARLRAKGARPDVLVMTATPIPRTLALTVYGDLDVSLIRELPPGRQPVRTTVRPMSRRTEVYAFVARELDQGRQAYVVAPIIEESDKIDVRAATELADDLAGQLPSYRIGLLHGRLPADAKARVMAAFQARELDLLVATSVIEVGVDVANATVMVVEHAERFGLAQLHQLRGRVGRGDHPSACVFLYQPPLTEAARARLKALAETADGFVLAERDLEIRGPGDFFGTRQSGVPRFRVGDLVRDRALLDEARREARAWVDAGGGLDRVPGWAPEDWPRRFGLVDVG